MTDYKTSVVTLLVLSTFLLTSGQLCSRVEYTEDACRSANKITVANQDVQKGTEDTRVTLPGGQTEADWFCGSSKERVAWDGVANQLRVNYLSDGTIQWTIYLCDDLSGPTEANLKCSVQEQNVACPYYNAESPSCVYEITTETTTGRMRSTTVSVSGEIAGEARVAAGITGTVTVGAGLEHTVTDAQTVRVSQGTYLVIPSGFSYCAYTEGTSVADTLAPTKFSWECSPTQFKQIVSANEDSCIPHSRCESTVCQFSNSGGGGGGGGAVQLQLSTTAILLCLGLFLLVLRIAN